MITSTFPDPADPTRRDTDEATIEAVRAGWLIAFWRRGHLCFVRRDDANELALRRAMDPDYLASVLAHERQARLARLN